MTHHLIYFTLHTSTHKQLAGAYIIYSKVHAVIGNLITKEIKHIV